MPSSSYAFFEWAGIGSVLLNKSSWATTKKSFFFIHSQCLNNNIIKAYYAYDGEQGAKENAHERAMFEKPPDFEHNELQEQQLLW